MDLRELTEMLRELVEGSALPTGATSSRATGIFKKSRSGNWERIQKTKKKIIKRISAKTWTRSEPKAASKKKTFKPRRIDSKTWSRSHARLRGKVKTQAGRAEKPRKSAIWQPNLAVSTKGHPAVETVMRTETELGALTESLRELAEGRSLPVGSFVKRKSGTFRKGKDGRWSRVQKHKVKVPRSIKNVGAFKTKGKDLFRKTRGGGWAKSAKTAVK